MSDVMVFKNPSFGSVRVVMINDEPWFVAKDVCDCLGFSDVSAALSSLDEDEKGINIIGTFSGDYQEMATVSDVGLYILMSQSRRLDVGTFRRWVAREILPSIRKPASRTYLEALKQRIVLEKARLAEEEEKRKTQIAFEQEKLVNPHELIAGVL